VCYLIALVPALAALHSARRFIPLAGIAGVTQLLPKWSDGFFLALAPTVKYLKLKTPNLNDTGTLLAIDFP
jgi:hypothetical protein